jgi:PAS domain S-box-containing protein
MEFFVSLVKRVADTIDADCVLIGEFTGGQLERVRTVAAYVDHQREADFVFTLAGSACAEVALGSPAVHPNGVQDLFPSDSLARELGIQACVAVPLKDTRQETIGVIMALYRRSFGNLRFPKSMLETFAPRAAAELERKQVDQAVRESEQRHQAFISQNPDSMWRIEFEVPIPVALPVEQQVDRIYQYGYIAECNEATARRFHAETIEQLIGSRLGDLALEPIHEGLRSAVGSGYKFTTVEVRPHDQEGNRRYLLRSYLGIVENGMLLRIWGTTRDITELRLAERTLAASEQRLTDLLENVHLMAVMLNCKGLVLFCNNYLLEVTGKRKQDVVGSNWFDLMIPVEEQDSLRTALQSACQGSPLVPHYESTVLGRDGSRRLVSWDSSLLRDADGSITGIAFVGRDITEYKAIEEQLQQAQKLEAIGRLTGGIAHDFNNLLTLILGYSGMLLAHQDPGSPSSLALSEIKKTAEKGAALTSQLLAFGRRQRVHAELLNLNSLIAYNERMLRRIIHEDIEFTMNLEPALTLVRVDAGQMHQVLLNLALNARDAMPQGGKLSITTANVLCEEGALPPVPGMVPGRYVLLSVSDSGIGMSKEVHAHLFEPFFTTKEPGKGTGLGLSTVYGIVQQSSGHILVETKVDNGTTFKIYLPSAEVRTKATDANPTKPVVIGGTETVLVVEDHRDVRILTANILRNLGYNVLEAENAGEALQKVMEHVEPIHLILADVVMPGTAGPELLRQVKAVNPKIKSLLMSGYGDSYSMDERVNAPWSADIKKPFTAEDLAGKVRRVLDDAERPAKDDLRKPQE